MNQRRVRATHEATLPHAAVAVWRYFHWPNLALMQPAGFFVDITYGDQQPNPGATRTVLLGAGHGNGTPLREVLESSDPATMCLRYRILDPAPMPVETYRGLVRVEPLTASSCVVKFESECTPNGMDDVTWRETYAAMQQASIEFIARTLAAG